MKIIDFKLRQLKKTKAKIEENIKKNREIYNFINEILNWWKLNANNIGECPNFVCIAKDIRDLGEEKYIIEQLRLLDGFRTEFSGFDPDEFIY